MTVVELLTYVTPVMSLVLVVVIYMNFKMQSLAKKYENYKADEFRQTIEKQMAELSKELSVNKERFNSINHLLLDAQNHYVKPDAVMSWSEMKKIDFFKSIGVKVSNSIDDTLAFVLTPFNEKYDEQYHVIKSVVTELGFRCTRGDDSNVSSNILGHIISEMSKARIVIANISGRNPNVFYELGIAHALGKPVIIVSESLADIPFDINSSRILAFENNQELEIRLRNWFVHTLAQSPNKSTNSGAAL